MGSRVSSGSEYIYSEAMPLYIESTLHYPTSVSGERKYACVFASVKHLDCICLYYAAAMGCSDLFLEACCHMLVTAVCGFVREEDRRTACVSVQMGRTPLTPTDVP